MKTLTVGISAAVLLGCQLALAQSAGTVSVIDSGWDDYHWRPHSSTAAEGFGHGLADVIRSAGQANLLSSEAAINYNKARSLALDNAAKTVSTYFDMRRMNADSRAAERGRRMSREEIYRVSQALLPRRLSPGELDPVTGRVAWPILLRGDDFASYRVDLDRLFAERTQGDLTTDQYLTLLERLGQMTEELRDQIEVIPTIDYIAAKRFLGSLTIEARAPIEPVARIGMNTRTTR